MGKEIQGRGFRPMGEREVIKARRSCGGRSWRGSRRGPVTEPENTGGLLGWDTRDAEDAHQEPFGFAAESKAHQVSDDLPGEVEAAGQLDVKAAVAEGAAVFGQRIVLQFKQEITDLTAGGGIAIEDVLLHFRRDLEFAGHAHPMVAKGSACGALSFGSGGGRC